MFLTRADARIFSKNKNLRIKLKCVFWCYNILFSSVQPNVNRRALNSLSLNQPHTLDSNTLILSQRVKQPTITARCLPHFLGLVVNMLL